ncbi:hypothetical protein QFZ91_004822 [Paraburkholderia sp. JPY419]
MSSLHVKIVDETSLGADIKQASGRRFSDKPFVLCKHLIDQFAQTDAATVAAGSLSLR